MVSKLLPNRVRRTYLGGSRIDAFTGVPAASGDGLPRPEDWLASTVQAFNGTLEIEGEGMGRIEDERRAKDVVGALPILVKLLDSDERLVVQAHPTVPCAKRLFGSPVGKTECWLFLPSTAPDACVYLGFRPGVARSSWEAAVRAEMESHAEPQRESLAQSLQRSQRVTTSRTLREDKPVLDFLHRIPVAAGDFVFVDGGVPHAIGAGCFLVELQEPSDLMVVAERLTPSGRRIPDAKMHGGAGWDAMFDVFEYDGRTFEETCARYVRRGPPAAASARICGPEFTDKFEMWRLAGGGALPLGGASAVVVVADGAGSLNGLPVRCGDRLIVSGEAALSASGDISAIVCLKNGGRTR